MFALIACLATSCERGGDEVSGKDVNSTLTISATMESGNVARSTESDGEFLWSTGDAIAVCTDAGTFARLDLDSASDGKAEGVFKGNLAPGESMSGYAVYPYSESHSWNGTTLGVNLPAEYGSATAAISRNTNAVMVAAIESPDATSFTFNHVAGVLKLSLANLPADAAKLVLTTDKGITGNFTVTDGEISTSTPAGNTSVTVRFAPLAASTSADFYIPLPTGSYENFTLSVQNADGIQLWGKAVASATGNTIARRTLALLSYALPETIGTPPFSAGAGTEANPYIISSTQDVTRFVQFANGEATPEIEVAVPMNEAHYALGADIDMKDVSYVPVTSFKGGFDGKGYKISNLTVTPVGTAPTGMFGSLSGATVKNLRLDNISVAVTAAEQLMTAAIAGQADSSTIEGCHIGGKVSSTASATFSVTGNGSTSVVAGVVAYANASTVKDCSFEGELSGNAQLVGGIVAQCDNSTVEGCAVNGGTSITGLLNQVGGIAAQVRLDSKIKGCNFDGHVKCKFAFNGGIVGRFEGGLVEGCVVGSSASVQGHTGNSKYDNIGTGGIVGHILTNATNKQAHINGCACYCDVAANLAVGGIAGVVRTSTADEKVYITNCLYKGSLTAASNNSYYYAMVGGILGFCDKKLGTVTVANCAGLVDGISFKSTATKLGAGGVGGVIQYNTAVSACYSTLEAVDIISHDTKLPVASTAITFYGGLFGASHGVSDNVSYTGCYHSDGCQIGANKSGTPAITDCSALSAQAMTDGTLLAKLNAAATAYNATAAEGTTACSWVAGADGYPVPSTVSADFTTPDTSGKTRVSLIGDSISTFAGYIPAGYTPFYPTGSVTSVTQTYWYKLIYNKMSNAKLDRNMAWSGTTVTRIVNSKYEGEHWYGNDFCARFIKDGMGNPDVVLIHGGTNDIWENGRGVVYLCPDYGINGDTLPSDATFQEVFDAASAAEAKGRAEIEKLEDTYFIHAYVKFVTLVHQQYPQAKVVILIGDWLGSTARQTLQKIAAHFSTLYGYRCVDFQNIENYSTVITKETGSHPNENGFNVMANYIYEQVGDYID